MLILGEITDKLSTVFELWMLMLVLSIPPLLLGFWHRWTGIALFLLTTPICILLAWSSYDDAYRGPLKSDIYNELGHIWIAHSILS